MNTRTLKQLIVAAPLLLVCACGGGGGGSADSGAVTLNSQLAIAANFTGAVVGVGDLAFAMVNEFEQGGTDLNGDGDFADNVMHMINATTGVKTNLGFAATGNAASNDTHIAWRAVEGHQGNLDLNADGDLADHVLIIFDPTLPVSPTNPLNTGVTLDPMSPLIGSDDFFVFATNELNEGSDLTGDMVLSDLVLQCFVTSSMTVVNTGMATLDFNFKADLGLLLFSAAESTVATMIDLNGDMDMSDTTLFFMRPSVGMVMPVSSGALMPHAIVLGSYDIYGTMAAPVFAYTISETDDGDVNLNGSGLTNDIDSEDNVCAVFDVNTLTETIPGGGLAIEALRFAGSATRLCISVIEAENSANGFDFNNDGDFDDLVPFWVDFANPSVANNIAIGQDDGATGLPLVCGDSILIRASEMAQGPNGTNYNGFQGDVDFDDFVFFHVRTTGGLTDFTNLRIAGNDALCAAESPDFITIIAEEGANGVDYNIDGDTSDEIAFFFPIISGAVVLPGRRVGSAGNTIVQDCGTTVRYISFAPENSSIAFGDANHDGDFDDIVLQTIQVRKIDGETTATSVLGTVEPNVGEMEFPILLSDTLVAFPSGEGTIGAGMNFNANLGDPDMFDSILFLGRLDCP